MYESRHQKPIPSHHFTLRIIRHALAVFGLMMISLVFGMAGYHYYEQLPWIDSFLNSAMLLGGMGPVNVPQTDGGKLFAGIYALYAGLFFVIAVAVMLAPMLHRILHLFHWKYDAQKN